MIIVLTFNRPHRKTQDVLLQMVARGFRPMVIAREYVERKNFVPLIPHRPSQVIPIELEKLCENLKLDYLEIHSSDLYQKLKQIDGIECILLATGNIIEPAIVQEYRVINAHPAWLPDIKGLDALKWAIFHDAVLGVTTHEVNEHIDSGILIERKKVPVYSSDTFHSVAYRQYEMEISMLIDSINTQPDNSLIGESNFEVFRRMPHRLEQELLQRFEMYKNKHALTH